MTLQDIFNKRFCAWLWVLYISLFIDASDGGLVFRDVVIVVLSQRDEYHVSLANELRNDIKLQSQQMQQDFPVVMLSHEEFTEPGSWTVFPLIPRLNSTFGTNSSWIFFCEERTHINMSNLVNMLQDYDHTEEMWIGNALYDREATIIHHFAYFESPQDFKYPCFASGFVISQAMLKRLSFRLHGKVSERNVDFSIDPSHEFATFVWDEGLGAALQHSPLLCLFNESHCASFPMPFISCGEPAKKNSLYFAVKTCEKFHLNRIPVVKETWGKDAEYIYYYSEKEDSKIPTISLGIPNSEIGHCSKTFGILKHAAEQANSIKDVHWIIVADDDTILSVSRLQELLSCFDNRQDIALGERYGFKVQSSFHGYNYITGGGGMVLSLPLVKKIVNSGKCRCPTIETADDMFLGVCLTRLGVVPIHSPFFHQARPSDYAPEYLASQKPVSFHKHWMINPFNVYNEWFAQMDNRTDSSIYSHAEL